MKWPQHSRRWSFRPYMRRTNLHRTTSSGHRMWVELGQNTPTWPERTIHRLLLHATAERERLETSLDKLNATSDKQFMLCGDFSCPGIDWSTRSIEKKPDIHHRIGSPPTFNRHFKQIRPYPNNYKRNKRTSIPPSCSGNRRPQTNRTFYTLDE